MVIFPEPGDFTHDPDGTEGVCAHGAAMTMVSVLVTRRVGEDDEPTHYVHGVHHFPLVDYVHDEEVEGLTNDLLDIIVMVQTPKDEKPAGHIPDREDVRRATDGLRSDQQVLGRYSLRELLGVFAANEFRVIVTGPGEPLVHPADPDVWSFFTQMQNAQAGSRIRGDLDPPLSMMPANMPLNVYRRVVERSASRGDGET